MNEYEYTASGIAVEYTERETLLMKDMTPTTKGFYRFLKEFGAERDAALERAEGLEKAIQKLIDKVKYEGTLAIAAEFVIQDLEESLAILEKEGV